MSQMSIFLSHASQDKAFADVLVRALRGAGADVWYGEHNLETGQLPDAVTRELQARPVFIVLLSKHAFASAWVRDECWWACNLHTSEPKRIILPVVAAPIEHGDFNAMLYLKDFMRVERLGNQPYSRAEAIEQTMQLLGLVHGSGAVRLTPLQQIDDSTPEAGEIPDLPDDIDELIECALEAYADGEDAELLVYEFEMATQEAPESVEAWAALGDLYFELQRWDDALAAYDRACILDPEFESAWYGKANALRALGREAEAQEAERRATE